MEPRAEPGVRRSRRRSGLVWLVIGLATAVSGVYLTISISYPAALGGSSARHRRCSLAGGAARTERATSTPAAHGCANLPSSSTCTTAWGRPPTRPGTGIAGDAARGATQRRSPRRDARRHPDGHAVYQAGRRLTPIQTGASRSGRRKCAADGIGVKAWRSACGVPYRPRYRHVPGPRWPRSRGGTGEFKGMVERYNGLPETPFLPGSSFTSRVGPFHVKHADLSRAGRRVRGDIRAVVPGR